MSRDCTEPRKEGGDRGGRGGGGGGGRYNNNRGGDRGGGERAPRGPKTCYHCGQVRFIAVCMLCRLIDCCVDCRTWM